MKRIDLPHADAARTAAQHRRKHLPLLIFAAALAFFLFQGKAPQDPRPGLAAESQAWINASTNAKQ